MQNLDGIGRQLLAGIGAAVAAARGGANTMVVERNSFAGGFFTAIMGSAFDGFVDERSDSPVIGGVVFEMLERMGVVERRSGVASQLQRKWGPQLCADAS